MFILHLIGLVFVGKTIFPELATGGFLHGQCSCRLPERGLTRCGEGLCECHNEMATCSGHCHGNQTLRYVPALPNDTCRLDFSCNNLSSIDYNFFENVTAVRWLDLSGNKLTYIHPQAFRRLTELTAISLAGNDLLDYQNLSVVLAIRSLQNLDISRCKLIRLLPRLFRNLSLPGLTSLDLSFNGLIGPNIFKNMSMPRLEHLNIAHNIMKKIYLSSFTLLERFETLDLTDNRFTVFKLSSALSVVKLFLSDNRLSVFPGLCKHNKTLVPNLRVIDLSSNNIENVEKRVCMPKLEFLDMNSNNVGRRRLNMFNGAMFPRLTSVSISCKNSLCLPALKIIFYDQPYLEEISLSNEFVFTKSVSQIFSKCPKLSTLRLSGNQFAFPLCTSVTDSQACQNITLLDMTLSKIRHIPEHDFIYCFTKLDHLILADNLLTSIPVGAFDNLTSLRKLDLSGNLISVLSPETFNVDTRQRLESLDLSRNPFQCSCDLLWLRELIRSSPLLFHYEFLLYKCHNIPHASVKTFSLDNQACMLSDTALIMITYTITIVLVTLTIASAVFRFRWHLRLLLYEVSRGRGELRRQILLNGNFTYDVFVSYDSEDTGWVREHLTPELEDRLGLRLCLHERDFIPGRDIVDNIATMVQTSKKVLMVFSNTFVASQWCQFELSFCLQHAMDTEDALIIVCVDDVASRDLTAAMMAVMKTTTYIQWVHGDGDVVRAFWGRLRAALHEVYKEQSV